MSKFYITTAIPYVNAPPHIGHALEFVETDALARHRRLGGEEVFLTTGSDENALKNVRAAEKEGVSAQALVDQNTELFKKFAQKLNIGVDGFDRGSDKKTHWPGVIELWQSCEKSGDIYKKNYRGLYCVGHEAFLTEKELVDGKCPDHGIEPEIIEEENYFFRLSKYQKELEKIISADEYRIVPASRKNEVLKFIKSGLEDFSVSRTKERAKGWGIPVPGDPTQVIYVWFDALAIYLTAVGFGTDGTKFKKWWPADVHVVGKDIIRFHAVYWPAMLLSAGLAPPKTLLAHGFVNSGGKKMSKSLNNIVDPNGYIDEFGADALRYFLLAEIPTLDDGNFTRGRFVERYNADLANGLGNLTARILTLASGNEFLDGAKSGLGSEIDKTWRLFESAFSEFDLKKAVEAVWTLIRRLDQYIDQTKPWASNDENVLRDLLTGLANIAWLIRPLLPQTSDKIFVGLGTTPDDSKWNFRPQKIEPLFPKIEQ